MNIQEFEESLAHNNPPANLSVALKALWLDANGNWQKSHELIQDLESKDAAWIHAYLHRKEGDETNAAYWYRRAEKKISKIDITQEWKAIVEELIRRE